MADSDIPNFESMTPPVTMAPPALRPAVTPIRATTWPTVLGIICMVFGVLGVLGALVAVYAVGAVMQEVLLGSGRYRLHTIVGLVAAAAMIVALPIALAIGRAA